MIYLHKTRDILDLNTFNHEAKIHNSKIEIVLKFNDDVLRFTLTEELTDDEDIALDNFVSSFVDTNPEDKIPLIYDYAKAEAKNKHFHNIDYKKELTVRLQKKSTINQGQMNVVTYYRNMEYQTINGIPTRVYSIPVLRTETEWTRDPSGWAICKNPPVRTYFNRDGTENPEIKVMEDAYFYEDFEQVIEGEKRRALIIKNLQKPVITLIAEVLMPLGTSIETIMLMGRKFMDEYNSEFHKFMENSSTVTEQLLGDGTNNPDYGKKTIVARLEKEGLVIDGVTYGNPDHVLWLNKMPLSIGGSTTIRQYLINEFSI